MENFEKIRPTAKKKYLNLISPINSIISSLISLGLFQKATLKNKNKNPCDLDQNPSRFSNIRISLSNGMDTQINNVLDRKRVVVASNSMKRKSHSSLIYYNKLTVKSFNHRHNLIPLKRQYKVLKFQSKSHHHKRNKSPVPIGLYHFIS